MLWNTRFLKSFQLLLFNEKCLCNNLIPVPDSQVLMSTSLCLSKSFLILFLSHFFCFSVTLPCLARSYFEASSLSLSLSFTYTHTHAHVHTLSLCLSLSGCLCSTGSKSLAAACSSPNLPSLCTIALGTKLRPHNSRPARVNSRANTVKAKTHFLLSPTSPAKN